MPIPQPLYLNATTLGDSTTVFLDNQLLNPAPDGFYSDGVIARQQVSGVLLPQQSCPSCGILCGGTISGAGAQGVYLLNINMGSTASDLGAIIIKFDPYGIPDGIQAVFNGVVYNELSSPSFGYLAGAAGFPTYIGNVASSCSVVTDGGTVVLDEFLYNGTSFLSTGNTPSITINTTQVSLTLGGPGLCVMVIPKTSATPSDISITCIGACASTGFNISVNCPILLPSFLATIATTHVVGGANCLLPWNQTYYVAKVAPDPTPPTVPPVLGLYDWVFTDAFGSSKLADGWYITNSLGPGGLDSFHIVNGVIIEFDSLCNL